jgi:hypothetical protein
MPGADRVEAQVLATLALSSAPAPPVLRVSSRTGQGLAELWQTIRAFPLKRDIGTDGRELLRLAQELLATRFETAERRAAVATLVERWRRGEAATGDAAGELLRVLALPAS